MTPLENKARLVLRNWIKTVEHGESALKLIDALEPAARAEHPGDRGEIKALREDDIRDGMAELEKTILTQRKL